MPVQMKEVFSSHVSAIGYDSAKKELVVSYRGRIARYKDVPPGVAETVMESPSVGKALQEHVRNKYAFRYGELDEAEEPSASVSRSGSDLDEI